MMKVRMNYGPAIPRYLSRMTIKTSNIDIFHYRYAADEITQPVQKALICLMTAKID